MNAYGMKLRDLAELEHYTNLKVAHLLWLDGSMPKHQKYLERVGERIWMTGPFTSARKTPVSLTPEDICDFIMKLKRLTYLHIVYDRSQCNHFKCEVDRVKALLLPRRPNFKFYISCCSIFDEHRVRSST